MRTQLNLSSFALLLICAAGCGIQMPSDRKSAISHIDPPNEKMADILSVQQAVEKLPVKVVKIPTLTSVGFASVSVQPGKSTNQKRILAIKAARLDALAKLTEQIHGIQISGSTKISEAIVQNDSLRADIQGVILGARTVKVDPTTSDTFQVTIEIDKSMIDAIVKAYA